MLLIVIMLLRGAGVADGQAQNTIFKPVWQWADPALKAKYGFGWPEGQPEGEIKECTCAHVDFATGTCSDNAAVGRVKTFPCGDGNHRGRSGHDEFKNGMRTAGGPCMCSTTPGKTENDACFAFKTEVMGKRFAATCLPAVQVMEDEWGYISVSALHDTSIDEPEPFILPPSEFPDPPRIAILKLIVDVEWGMLDIFNEEANALIATDSSCYFRCQGGDPKTAGQLCQGINDGTTCKGGGICSYRECNACCEETPQDVDARERLGSPNVCGETTRRCRFPGGLPAPKQLKYEYRGGVTGKHRLVVVGDWPGLMSVLLNLKYKALPDMTTLRLRSPQVSPESAVTQPFETVFYEITQVFAAERQAADGSPDGFDYSQALAGNLTVVVRIRGDNDPPVIFNPETTYQPPALCARLSDPSGCCNMKGAQSCCQCHFGQYYAFEDSAEVLEITGMTVEDVDLEEADTEARLDVKLLAKKGNVNLNSRTGLVFYDEAVRNGRGFSGFLAKADATNNAIKLLKYRVETPELVNTEASAVYNYNTQQDGEEEYFDITFNDQGYTSDRGEVYPFPSLALPPPPPMSAVLLETRPRLVLPSVDRMRTALRGLDRTATGLDRTATGLDRACGGRRSSSRRACT